MSTPAVRHSHGLTQELQDRPAQPGAGNIQAYVIEQSESYRTGIWQMSAGTLSGVSGHETVVILEGEADVELEASGEIYSLRVGDVFVLGPNEVATWHVHKHVRKFYFINHA